MNRLSAVLFSVRNEQSPSAVLLRSFDFWTFSFFLSGDYAQWRSVECCFWKTFSRWYMIHIVVLDLFLWERNMLAVITSHNERVWGGWRVLVLRHRAGSCCLSFAAGTPSACWNWYESGRRDVTHFAYDLSAARTDPNAVLPLRALNELVDNGRIGALRRMR